MSTVWIINQYASTPDKGIGGRSFYLARELVKKGVNVYLIASSSNHLLREKVEVGSRYTIDVRDGVNFVWVKMPGYEAAHSKRRVFNWFLFAFYILGLAKFIPLRPDAILYSSPSLVGFLGAKRLAKKFGARLVFEVRDIWPLTLTEIGGYAASHPFIKFLQWVEDKAYRDSDKVVSNLKNAREHMISRGLQEDKFFWVSNGFSKEEFDNPEPLLFDRASLTPENSFVVGYAGTFGLANDLFTLVGAFEELKDYKDIYLVLVGGGKEKEGIFNHVSERGLSNVIFVDAVRKAQVQSVLSFFDVLAVGAKKEPMYRFGVSPNKLFDYFAAGKPILYYIESGDYHPIKDSGCGVEVESGNPRILSRAILELYSLPRSELDRMGSNGRAIAMQEYEYGVLADKLFRVLF